MLGLSGVSSDFRDLLASPDPRARFALEVFVYRVARGIGSLAAAMGGLDGIVFTAGVGENAAPVRAAVCEACAWLGVELDPAANMSHGPRISRRGARAAAYVDPHRREPDDRAAHPRRDLRRKVNAMAQLDETELPPILAGRKALVVGVANEHSIAWGCAKALRRAGAESP